MADTATITTEEVQGQVPEGRREYTINTDSLVSGIFGIEPPKKTEVEKTETAAPVVQATTSEAIPGATPAVEAPAATTTWINDFGWENEETAKAEIKKLKEATPQEIKFADDQSKKIYELLKEGKSKEVKNFLETQEKIDNYLSAEINKDNAAEIIKLGMKMKYAGLSDTEIGYKYNKEYGTPKEPTIRENELDEEFDQRKAEWQELVNDIETNRVIEAKILQPELEKQKANLVLPELDSRKVQKPPTQEELEAAQKYESDYIQSVDNSIKNFNGFSVAVKHEGVDLPVTYGVTNEEKVSLANQLKELAKNNYDVNTLFADRWVNDNGTLKSEQMIKDLSVLNNYEKAFQKFASDSSSKVLEAYVKGKKNIDINGSSTSNAETFGKDEKTELDTVRDQFFAGIR
mgnify:CR=1 FL=1